MKVAKKILIHICIGFLGFSATGFAQEIPPKPQPAHFVNDYALFLNEAETFQLEIKLKAYNDSTSTQIVIVTLESLQGYTIEEYANTWARAWGIGQKGKDNGLLLILSKAERKARIETGYGMEGIIPDLKAKQIQSDYLSPNLKNGNYYKAFDETTTALIQAAKGAFIKENPKTIDTENREQTDFIFIIVIVVMLFVFILLMIFLIRNIFINTYQTATFSSTTVKNTSYKNKPSTNTDSSQNTGGGVVVVDTTIPTYHDYSDNKYSDYNDYSDTSSYSDSSSSYSDSSFGGGDFGGGGASSDW